MPPKKQDKKVAEEDYSDVATLPKLNSLNFTVFYNFLSKSHRDDLQKSVNDWIGGQGDKIKTITRDQIVEYGKARGIITDAPVPSEENPNPVHDELGQLAKSAADKLYEQVVGCMRAKKDKITKLEEEAKATATEENPDPKPNINPDEVDNLYQFVDFPQNEEEALAFAKCKDPTREMSLALNAVILFKEKLGMKEVKEEDPNGEAEPTVTLKEDEIAEEDKIPDEENVQIQDIFKKLTSSIKAAPKGSDARMTAIKELTYVHHIEEAAPPVEGEEQPPEPKNSIKEDTEKFSHEIQKLADHLVKYQRFREKVNLKQLAVKPQVKEEQNNRSQLASQPRSQVESVKEGTQEQVPEGSQPPAAEEPPAEGDEAAAEAAVPEKAVEVILDEVERDWKGFKVYYQNLENVDKNLLGVSSLVSSAIVHISSQLDKEEEEEEEEGLNDVDELDSFFNDVFGEVIQGPGAGAFNQSETSAETKQQFSRQATNSPKSDFSTSGIPLYNELDYASSKHLQSVLSNGDSVAEKKHNVISSYLVPGFQRHNMPAVAQKSALLREAEKAEIYPFLTLPIESMERGMILNHLSEMMTEAANRPYNFFNRDYEERMSPKILKQVVMNAMLLEPDIQTKYYAREDALLVGLYYKTPPGRVIRKQWTSTYSVMPDFGNWLEWFPNDFLPPNGLYDIDDGKVGQVREKLKLMMPSDKSVIKISKYSIGNEDYTKSVVYKDNLIFGVRQRSDEEAKDELKVNSELFLEFENQVKLNVNLHKYERRVAKVVETPVPGEGEEPAEGAEPVEGEEAAKEPHFEETTEVNQGSETTLTFTNGLIVKFLHDGDIYQKIQGAESEETHRVLTGKGTVVRHLKNGDIQMLFANGNVSTFSQETQLWHIVNNKGLRRAKTKDSLIQCEVDPIPCATKTDPETGARIMIREDSTISIRYTDGRLFTQHCDGTKILTSPDGLTIIVEKDDFAPVKFHLDVHQTQPYQESEGGQSDQEEVPRIKTIQQLMQGGRMTETVLPDQTIVKTVKILKPDVEHTDEEIQEEALETFNLIERQDYSIIGIKQTGEVVIVSSNERDALCKERNDTLGRDAQYLNEIFTAPELRAQGIYTADLGDQVSTVWIRDHEGNHFQVDSNGASSETIAAQEHHIEEEVQEGSLQQTEARPISPPFKDGEYVDEDTKNMPPPGDIYEPRLFIIRPDGTGSEFFNEGQLEYYLRIKTKLSKRIKNKPSSRGKTPPGRGKRGGRGRSRGIKKSGAGGTTGGGGNEEGQKRRPPTPVDPLDQDVFLDENQIFIGDEVVTILSFLTKSKTFDAQKQTYTLIGQIPLPKNIEACEMPSYKAPLPVLNKYQQLSHISFRNLIKHMEFDEFKTQSYLDDMKRYQEFKERIDKSYIELGPQGDQRSDDDKYYDGRIIKRIFKERQKPRPYFSSNELNRKIIKECLPFQDFKKQDSVGFEALHQVTEENLETDRDGATSIPRAGETQQLENFGVQQQHKTSKAQANIDKIQKMLQTPTFVPQYFGSKFGKDWLKDNPQKPPTDEYLMRVAQRKSKHQSENGGTLSQGQEGDRSMKNEFDDGQEPDNQDGEDNPIVALEPEDDDAHKASMGRQANLRASQRMSLEEATAKPSFYKQEKGFLQAREEQRQMNSENYHVTKTKEFNVYGNLRQDQLMVSSIKKSGIQPELNEKFITTESITDRRIKISSMANRAYANAPTVEQARKLGQHQMILSAIDKKQTFHEMISHANAMVTSVLNDPLKRSFNVLPESARFGPLKAGGSYEMTISCKNEDMLTQRITVRNPQDQRIKVRQETTGPIAPGIIRRIIIVVNTKEDDSGKIEDEIQIVTKTDVYRIPVFANVMGQEQYDELEKEYQALHHKSAQKPNVRVKPPSRTGGPRKWRKDLARMTGEDFAPGDHEEDVEGEEQKDQNRWVETTGSETKLPNLPNFDKRPFEVDPKKSLNEVLRDQQDGGTFSGQRGSQSSTKK